MLVGETPADADCGFLGLCHYQSFIARTMTQDDAGFGFDTPVQFVPGVGPARAKLFERLEIRVADDLLWHLPRDIIDLTHVVGPSELVDGELATVRGTVSDLDARKTARGGTLSSVLLECSAGDGPAGFVRGLWFNQPWQLNKFKAALASGAEVLLSGKPKFKAGRWEFSHPQIQVLAIDEDEPEQGDDELGDDSHSGDPAEPPRRQAAVGLFPKYPLTEGLTQYYARKACSYAAGMLAASVADPFPKPFCEANDLVDLPEALLGLHVPQARLDYDAGWRRILYEDMFTFQLGLALRRRAWMRSPHGPRIEVTGKIDARIRRLFPFRCTRGQDDAIAEMVSDMANEFPMHRLLQADVGAGKTVVAIYVMLAAVAAGYQAVLMAPTELLAVQHAATFEAMLQHSRVRRAVLTGRLTAAERRDTLAAIKAGDVDVVIGTQAVIQADVSFAKLGMVVIDEQHKFGVEQRAHFSRVDNDGRGTSPHVLVMTATPIPRSLCLTQFGDLDLTVIKERPPGRQPVTTARVLTSVQRKKMWDFVRKKLTEGRQVYIVSPRVDGDDDVPGAERLFAELSDGELRGVRVGLLHGRLDREERARVMDEFRVGNVDAVVATTVIEVGVDVANATVMVIESANLFGLSQLHQLRGRIGRGTHRSFCFLVSDAEASGGETTTAAARLAVMEETDDGFDIAERDFEIRGAGDVLGTRQAGQDSLRFANLVRDQVLLNESRKAAFQLVASAEIDRPEYAALKRAVLDRFGDLMDLPRSG